jgi:hypothetical protein
MGEGLLYDTGRMLSLLHSDHLYSGKCYYIIECYGASDWTTVDWWSVDNEVTSVNREKIQNIYLIAITGFVHCFNQMNLFMFTKYSNVLKWE